MFAVYLNGITSAQASDLSVMGAQVDQNYDTNTHTFTQNYASVFALEPCTPNTFLSYPTFKPILLTMEWTIIGSVSPSTKPTKLEDSSLEMPNI